MRTYTTTVREGERVGDVDWNYDFRQHFNNHCVSDTRRDAICAESVAMLRMIADAVANGRKVLATTDGGWPKFGFNEVIDIGMYDGWPFWKPVPSVLTRGPLGPEWHSFSMLTEFILK